MDVDAKPRPLIASPNVERSFPSFSPDGQWLAYVSDESGRHTGVCDIPYPDSTSNGWSRQSRAVECHLGHRMAPSFFIDSGDKIMVVPIQTRPTFKAGKPRVLFEGFPLVGRDISPDGQRFLMMKQGGSHGKRPQGKPNQCCPELV